MAPLILFYKQPVLTAIAIIVFCALTVASNDIQCAGRRSQGKIKSYKNRVGRHGLLVCLKEDGVYRWRGMDDSLTIGEKFDPAKDCADIVEKLPDAKDGFYWIAVEGGEPQRAWCDVYTDEGGFMLVGKQNSSDMWAVPSSKTPVEPYGPARFSSSFGKVNVQDFAIQISTNESFQETNAHWFYRLNSKRELGSLFGTGNGFCPEHFSGIGNISLVKDILTDTIVTTRFNCSKFGTNGGGFGGWAQMNYCLTKDCPKGYAYFERPPDGRLVRLYGHGSLSYSAASSISGMSRSSTAFVGCVNENCCACYGPKGGRLNYCSKGCTSINGGTVTQQVYVWFWVRTRTPKRLWKKCMEFKKKSDDGKLETHFVDERTGATRMGSCSNKVDTLLNEGTLTVKDIESFEKIPSVPGLLTYRKDNEKLYVNKGPQWEALSSEKTVLDLVSEIRRATKATVDKLRRRIEYLENKMPSGDEINRKFKSLEDQLLPGCTHARALGMESGRIPNHMTASTSEWPYGGAPNARLNFRAQGSRKGAWIPRHNNYNQYLIVDLGRPYIVTGISTQGRQDAYQFVTSYRISYGNDGRNYRYVETGGVVKEFHGNNDQDSIVQHFFVPSLTTRNIRVHPTSWYSQIALRIELYGCST